MKIKWATGHQLNLLSITKTWVLGSSLDGWTLQVNLKFSCNQFLEIIQAPSITFSNVLESNYLKIELKKIVLSSTSYQIFWQSQILENNLLSLMCLSSPNPLNSVIVCGEIRRSWICYRWHLFFSTRARLAGNILVLCKRL